MCLKYTENEPSDNHGLFGKLAVNPAMCSSLDWYIFRYLNAIHFFDDKHVVEH